MRISTNLKEVRKLPKGYVFLSQDVPVKSSWSIPVHIAQKHGLAFVVAPSNPDEFIDGYQKLNLCNFKTITNMWTTERTPQLKGSGVFVRWLQSDDSPTGRGRHVLNVLVCIIPRNTCGMRFYGDLGFATHRTGSNSVFLWGFMVLSMAVI